VVWIQNDYGPLVPLHNCQIRIGALGFRRELRVSLFWLGASKVTFPGTQTDQHELVIFTALQAQRSAVGPVGQNGPTDLPHAKRKLEASRVGGDQVADDLTEEPAQIAHL
jgi:hypothetical protein